MGKKEIAALLSGILPPGLCQFSPESIALLGKFLGMLVLWKRSINLVGAKSAPEILQNLVPDSFHLAKFLASLPLPPNPRVWEPGAGAGLPGIPLRILWQQGEYVMLEARAKRAIFLANALAALKLPRTRAFSGRAEDFFRKQKEKGILADCILSRAFMPWPKLLPFCGPFLRQGGFLTIMSREAPGPLPPDWCLADALAYEARGGKYWLWAITPHLADNDKEY